LRSPRVWKLKRVEFPNLPGAGGTNAAVLKHRWTDRSSAILCDGGFLESVLSNRARRLGRVDRGHGGASGDGGRRTRRAAVRRGRAGRPRVGASEFPWAACRGMSGLVHFPTKCARR
jgi:hypothetical protein